jgi:diguanylate cyclase (GGDEF)-like protein
MAKSVAGRITLNLVTEIIVTLVTVSLAIFWMAHRQNDQAEEASKTMVLGGISSMEDHVKQFANDYAWWEAGYDAYVKGDREWVDVNFGSGVTDTQISDILVIISPQGDVPYSWAIDNDHGTPTEIFTPHVRDEIRALLKGVPVENEQARSGYFRVGNDILLVAVARMAPVSRVSEVDPATLPFLVQGIYLSRQRLVELGSQFLLDDVHLQVGTPNDEVRAAGFPLVADLDGKTIGAFIWTPINSGFIALRAVAGPVSAALALFCIVAFGAAYRTRRLAVKLTESEQEAVTASRTDSMTGLMNRNGFNELVESDVYESACGQGQFAVIYLDVNGFKAVNDSIGHHGGDELVRALAKRIDGALPEGAALARIGGDEFAVAVLTGGADTNVADTAHLLAHSIDKPFTISGFEFHVTASVGFAIANEPGMKSVEVIRRADLAMYQAKNGAERDPIAYHASMETGALEKKQIESGLRKAIENGDLKVFYQPVVRAEDLKIVGLEALVRWTSSEFGAVSPAAFIPVAEETGLIHDIGRWVVRRACEDLHRWPTLHMAINVSPVQLRDPHFADEIRRIVESYGHSPERFELELTEGILVNNPTIAQRKLKMLKDSGFALSLDDFGTGFSSIGYLRQFPFDILKVDRSFVRDIGMNGTANALLQSLVSLGDALELSVIAEGIETEDQLKLLRLMRCGCIQGFLFSKPVSADDIDALLAKQAENAWVIGGGVGEDRRVASASA